MIRQLTAVLAILATSLCAGVINYPWPAEAPKSSTYSVRIIQDGVASDMTTLYSEPYQVPGPDGTGLAGFLAGFLAGRSLSYLPFAFTGQIEVEVTKLFGTTAPRVEISPKEYGIEPTFFNGRTVRFPLTNLAGRPEYISINFVTSDNLDANGTGNDIKHGLMLFGDAPEANPPNPSSPGTIVYSPAVTATQLANANVIYFPPGFHDLTLRYPSNPFRAVLPLSKNGQRVHVAGGAFVRGAIHGKGKDNLTIDGRGIFSGHEMVWHDIRDEAGIKTAHMNFVGSDDCLFEGFTIVNPIHHTLPCSNRNTYRQFKIIGWSWNSDGVRPASGSLFEEIFIKTMDDYDYARDPHIGRNSVIWPMQNGAFGQLGWNNLGTGGTTYQNIRFINSEWMTYNRNRGIIGSVLNQGVNLSNNLIENLYCENSMALLANITIQLDPARPFDPTKPGLIRDFTFRNIILEKPFLSPSGSLVKNPIKGFIHEGSTAIVRDIQFINLVAGNTLVTQANHAQFFDIDPATTSNITFTTEGPIHTVTATHTTGGSLSPSGALPTPEGMTRVITAIPASGKRIKRVLINGVDSGRLQNIRFPNISNNHTVHVEFENGNDYFDFTNTPPQPSNSQATPSGTSTIQLSWTDNSTNETGFEIQWSPDGSSAWTQLAVKAANTNTHSDAGLSPGTTRHYRLRSLGTQNPSAWTVPVSATTLPLPPTAPGSLAITSSTSITHALSWQDNAGNETSQEIQRAPASSESWTTVATIAADLQTHTDSGLLPNSTWKYRIRALNAGGASAWSNTAIGTTTSSPSQTVNLLLGHTSNTTISSQLSRAHYLIPSDGILAANGTTMTIAPSNPWRFTAGQQTGLSGGGSFSLRFSAYQDVDTTTGLGVSPPEGYNIITSNGIGLGIANGANGNFIGNTTGPDGEEGMVFGIDATGLPMGTQIRVANITLQQTGTNTFSGNDSVAIIRRTAPAAIATTTLGTVENPILFQTIDLTNLDITVAGGSEIPECLTIFNATDGSQRGFRIQSIGLEISNAPANSASIQLTNLEQTYNSSPLAAGTLTSPAGLDVQVLYTIPGQAFPTTNPPAAVGSYPVTASIITPGFTGSTSGTFIISKATGNISFSSLVQTYDGTPRTVTASSSPPANMVIDYGGSTTAPITVGTYPVTATINDPNVEGSASGQLIVQKGSATVLANPIIRTSNGNPVFGEATTSPSGLALEFLYNGIPTAPSLPGSYPYTATLSDPNRSGSASSTIAILPASPPNTTLLLGHNNNTTIISQTSLATYSIAANGILTLDGTSMSLSVPQEWRHLANQNTSHPFPGSFTLQFTAWNDLDANTGAGASPVGGSNNTTSNGVGIGVGAGPNGNFVGNLAGPDGEEGFIFGINASNLPTDSTFVITSLTLGQSASSFSGNDSVRVIRRNGPPGSLTTTLGSAESPVISQTIDLTPLGILINGGTHIPELFSIMNGTDASQHGFRISAIGIALLTRSDNPATIQISSLSPTYNGVAKPVTITTNPPGLDVAVTYTREGDPPSTEAPINAGSYQVDATVTTSGFTGSSSATLIIAKALATVTAQNITSDYIEGTPVYGNATTQPANLDLLYTYNNSEDPPTNPGVYPYRADVIDPNHTGFAEATITIIAPNTYSYWAQVHTGGGPPNGDHDQDGMPNAIEYLMGETGNSFTPNPPIINNTITWPKDPDANASWQVQVSDTLDLLSWQPAPAPAVNDTGSSIIFTLPAGQQRKFTRLEVVIWEPSSLPEKQ
jgi:hypothetical protein